MGETAETLAREYGILRAEQDAYAVESQRRAGRARSEGRFDDEIVPVAVPGKKGERRRLRGRASAARHDRRSRSRSCRRSSIPQGTVHAGNSSGITDGAAALVLASEEEVGERGRRAARPRRGLDFGGRRSGAHGHRPGPGDPGAPREDGAARSPTSTSIELNEAFAAQVIACARDLPLDLAKVNVNGGAIALGHPIGATGARIATTLLHEMKRRGARRGIATLCVSGGMGMAVLFERADARSP